MIRTPVAGVRRRVALTAAALSVPLALSACGGSAPEAGSAAVVGDRRISVHDVQRATADIQAYYPGQSVTQQQVLFFLIGGPAIVSEAAKAGVGYSAADAKGELGQKLASPSDPGIAVYQANQAISRVSDLEAAKKQAVVDAIRQDLAAANIKVNPRYGTFDPQTLDIVPATQNWLVQKSPAAQPAQQPAPADGSGATPAPSEVVPSPAAS